MLEFMKTKILIPLSIIIVLIGFFSFRYAKGEGSVPTTRHELVLQSVMKTIQDGHFSPRNLDDSFSARIYDKMLDNLDYEKKFFTQQEINKLKANRYQIDDQIKENSTVFFDSIDTLFKTGLTRAEGYYKEILKTPFAFNGNEKIQLNGDKLAFAADETALKARWSQYLKYRVLSKYVDLKDAQEKDKTATKKKTDAELEAEARASVQKNQESFFRRLRKVDDNQRFAIYINAITNSEDPHTDYFPPKDKLRFDEAMSGSFSGIGAQLRDEDGKIKIAGIIAGSPSWKQGQLKTGDEIQKVGQGSAEPEDIQGWEIDDVVQKIRGKKGTEVRLTVKKVDGSMKVIPIVRGDVQIEETFARSAVIQGKSGPIGYIYLPEFYADFNKRDGRRCAEDVAIEVQKLKSAGVAGIILDLRNNGGGSLSDVVDMGGLFIDQGPIVQVKSSDAPPMTLRDNSKGSLYDGPLAIMVNTGSASASEIMAAAMQDYKRAVIVGTPTFGKGTVQKVVSLDENIDPMTRMQIASSEKGNELLGTPVGALKLTMQKFYRVNGGSTQMKGVTPDVILPDPYAHIDLGESRDKAALPWDEIPAASYQASRNAINTADLASKSRARVTANPIFTLIQENSKKLKAQEEDHLYSLNEAAYRKELADANATSKKMEELEKKGTPLTITNLKEDLAQINRDSSTVTKNNDWIKNLKKDIYISETVNIVNDMTGNKPAMKVSANGMGMK